MKIEKDREWTFPSMQVKTVKSCREIYIILQTLKPPNWPLNSWTLGKLLHISDTPMPHKWTLLAEDYFDWFERFSLFVWFLLNVIPLFRLSKYCFFQMLCFDDGLWPVGYPWAVHRLSSCNFIVYINSTKHQMNECDKSKNHTVAVFSKWPSYVITRSSWSNSISIRISQFISNGILDCIPPIIVHFSSKDSVSIKFFGPESVLVSCGARLASRQFQTAQHLGMELTNQYIGPFGEGLF